MLGIIDVPRARQLIAALAMFAAALAVALPRDRSISATWLSDTSAGENEVDIGEAVLDSFRVVLDTARMEQYRRFCRPPNLCGANNVGSWNAGNRFGESGRIRLNELPYLFKAFG